MKKMGMFSSKAWKSKRLTFQNTHWVLLYFQVSGVTFQSLLLKRLCTKYCHCWKYVLKYPFFYFLSLCHWFKKKERPSQWFLTYIADFFQQSPRDLQLGSSVIQKCAGVGYPWPCHKAVETMVLDVCELLQVLTCQIWQCFLNHKSSSM